MIPFIFNMISKAFSDSVEPTGHHRFLQLSGFSSIALICIGLGYLITWGSREPNLVFEVAVALLLLVSAGLVCLLLALVRSMTVNLSSNRTARHFLWTKILLCAGASLLFIAMISDAMINFLTN